MRYMMGNSILRFLFYKVFKTYFITHSQQVPTTILPNECPSFKSNKQTAKGHLWGEGDRERNTRPLAVEQPRYGVPKRGEEGIYLLSISNTRAFLKGERGTTCL
jgi:hypothetical protein